MNGNRPLVKEISDLNTQSNEPHTINKDVKPVNLRLLSIGLDEHRYKDLGQLEKFELLIDLGLRKLGVYGK